MKTTLRIIAALVVLAPVAAAAQTPTTGVAGQKFAWEQAALTLADAQALTYTYYADGATTGVVFTGVTCTGTASPFTCEALIPAFAPGPHSVTVTAKNVAGESPKSAPLAFTFVVTPGQPVNVRIK